MSQQKSAPRFAIFLLPALLFLPACESLSNSKFKLRVLECRNPPESPISDAPDKMPEYIPFSVELLGVIELERKLDAEEWRCVENL